MDGSHRCGDGAKLGAGVEVGERRGNGDRDRDGEAIGISLGVSIRVVVRNHCHGLYEANRLIALVRAFHSVSSITKGSAGPGFRVSLKFLTGIYDCDRSALILSSGLRVMPSKKCFARTP